MTWFNALQLILAAAALTVISRRLHALLFVAPLEVDPFLTALETALLSQQTALARQIANACAPAWPARLAAAALAEPDRGNLKAVLEETQLDLEAAADQGLGAIVAFGRMASPLAFIGVMLEIGRAFGGGGVQGLQRGLVASLALERSLLTFAIGAATFAVCFVAATILQRRARRLRAELRRVASLIAQRAGQ